MAFNWVKRFLTPEPETVEEPRPDIRDRESIWASTHRLDKPLKSPQSVEIPGPEFKAHIQVGATEIPEGVTFDEVSKTYGMDSTNLKQTFSLGQGQIPDSLFNWFNSQTFIGPQACAVVSQHWLINKALMIPAKDAVRNGYTLGSVDGEDVDLDVLAQLSAQSKKFKVSQNLIEYATNTRRFGIRIALFNVESNDPEYYSKPFNIDGVKKGSYKGISQVDPTWVAPILDQDAAANPASMDFYEPTYWLISGQLYHKSHVVVSRYMDVPDVLKPAYQYGGLPLTQLLLERVYAAERTANEAPMLVQTKRLNVIYAELAAIEANPLGFQAKLEQLIEYRDNYGVYVAGTDDKMEQIETSLSDLDAVIMTEYQLVAAISEVPATKLMGTSPKGFNATGEFEQSSYYDLLENIQTDLTPVIERHNELSARSLGLGDLDLEVVWNPTSSPDAKEQAEINLLKAQTSAQLQLTGSIDAEDIRNELIADPKSGYTMLTPFEDLENLPDKGFNFGDLDGPGPGGGGGSETADPSAPEKPAVKEGSKAKEDQETVETKPTKKAEDYGESNVSGYVRITPTPEIAADLHIWATRAGVVNPNRPSEFHSTLMWSHVGIPEYKTDDSTYKLTPTGVGILGDEKPALVVFVESKDLRARVKALEEMGAASDYPEFIPHVALKYAPTPEDLENAKAYYAKNGMPKITMGEEIRQVL